MVTVKREPSPAFIESANPEDIRQNDFNYFGATPPPLAYPIVTPQVPWWTPRTKPVPGPQENFEFEFQVPPPIWPTSPTAQIKAPDRTIPTMLDRYEMALKLAAEQGKRQLEIGKDASGSTSADSISPAKGKQAEVSTGKAWIPPEGWRESNRAEYELQSRVLDQQCKSKVEDYELGIRLKDQRNKLGLEVERQRQNAGSSAQSVWAHSGIDRNQQNSVGPVSGSVWSPPPGWEESLEPQFREALDYLRKAVTGMRTSMMKEPAPKLKQLWVATSSNIPEPYPQLSSIPQMGEPHTTQAGYQMQLMLLEQQNKKRLMVARHTQEAMFEQRQQSTLEATPADRESSVDSVWSAQFTPESTPGFPELAGIHIKYEGGERPTGFMSCYVPGEQYSNSTESVHNLQDYELQLAMLEQQKQARLMIAQTSTSHALKGAHQEYQQDPTQNSREIKIEGEVVQALGLNTLENLEKRMASQPSNQPLMDQEHKKKSIGRVSTSPQTVVQYEYGTKEYQAQMSQEYENYAKQPQADLEAARREGDGIAVEYYQINLEAVERQNKATPWLMKSWNQHQESIKASESRSMSQSTMGQQQNQQRSTGELTPTSEAPNWSPREYQQELIKNKAQQQQLRVTAAAAKSAGDVIAFQRHHSSMTVLEDRYNDIDSILRAWEERNQGPASMPPPDGSHALQDHQMQLVLLEQQNRRRLMMARQEQESLRTPMPPSNGSHALQDHQMQLMLLEQHNKKTLMMARQEQESLQTRMTLYNGNHALQDYQMQLMLLEQQNKKRLPRQEGEAQAIRNVKQRTDSISPTEHTDDGATWDSSPDVAGKSQRNILHNKPLVFRGRPTCDD